MSSSATSFSQSSTGTDTLHHLRQLEQTQIPRQPSPPVNTRVHFPYPLHHFAPGHPHPMVVGSAPPQPLLAWTPQHHRPPMPYFHGHNAWECSHPQHQPPSLHFYPAFSIAVSGSANGKTTRPSDQSLVTPTPNKKVRRGDASEPSTTYSRKKKSLGLLAGTFLSRFTNDDKGQEIYIDQLADQLQVERRRIYDVVNILESLRVVVKKGKNAYHWMGTEHLPRFFAILQHDAIYDHANDAVALGLVTQKPSEEEIHAAQANQDLVGAKSLSRLSQLFLRCYLVGHITLSLPEASDKIHGETTTISDLAELGCKNRGHTVPHNDPKLFQQAAMRGLKTKIRRLYDIANVFISIGLLKKVDERVMPLEARRPRFMWNYQLSAKEILQLYGNMPEKLKRDRNPFDDGFDKSRPGAATTITTPPLAVAATTSPARLEPPTPLDVDRESPGGSDNVFGSIHVTGGAVTTEQPPQWL
jgi:hypothetical protein